MEDIVVVGTGGLAREVSSYFSDHFKILGYASIDKTNHQKYALQGVDFGDDITPEIVGTSNIVIAIGNPEKKKKVYEVLQNRGFSFPALIHPSSVVSGSAIVGLGVVVSPNCVVSSNANLKMFSYINFCCGVGHDAVIGEFVQVNPGCQLGGFSIIGEGSLIGSGSLILQNVHVGERATVGSGSVVFSKVSPGSTVMGNPARRMRALEK